MSQHSQSSVDREYFSPYSLRPRDDQRYSTDQTPISQSYLLPPQITSTLSQPTSPHYSNSPYDHPSYPHSAPATPLPPPPHISLPSNHGGAYLDAYPGVHHIPMQHVMGMEHIDTGLRMDINVLSSQEHPNYQLLQREGLTPVGRRRAMSAESMDLNPDGRRGRGGKKQRGRPRLDTKDENAADRRRTQIRLAQRAYRMRKETTITSLKSRVEELEGVIDSMKNLFFELEDAARARDTEDYEKYIDCISGISDRFQMISYTSPLLPATSELGGDSQNEDEDRQQPEEKSTLGKPRSRDGDSGSGSGSTSALNITNTLSTTSASSWGYPTSNTRSTSDQGSGQPSLSGAHSQHSGSTSSYLQTVTPEPEPILENSYSYYFQDASFSRRLHRAALEHAQSLLVDPNADEDRVNRVFAYTFCYRTKEDVLASIKKTLSKRSSSQFPALSEFPGILAEEYEQLQFFQADFAAYQSGVRTPPELETPTNDPTSDLRIEAYKQLVRLGVNQKYLRPDDVEQILIEIGILLETNTSVEPVNNRDNYNSNSMDINLNSFDLPHDASVQSPSNPDGFDPSFSGAADEKMISDDDAVAIGLFSSPHTSPATAEEFQSQYPTKVVLGVRNPVNIERLLQELVERGVCLGQFPAFRRADIDLAIRIAATSASSGTSVSTSSGASSSDSATASTATTVTNLLC